MNIQPCAICGDFNCCKPHNENEMSAIRENNMFLKQRRSVEKREKIITDWVRSLIAWRSGPDGDHEDEIIGFDFISLDTELGEILIKAGYKP